MKCNCDSYNLDKPDSGKDKGIILTPPDYLFKSMDRETRSICIDKCIALVILHLWENDIVTLGCCCGHNKSNPSVIVKGVLSGRFNYLNKIFSLIKEVDDRCWKVCEWELVQYNMWEFNHFK